MPGWLLAAVAIVAAVCVAAAAVSLSRSPAGEKAVTVANDNSSVATTGQDAGKTITYNHTITVEADGAQALDAAKTAIVPVLSYDYRHMQQSKTRAGAYMTDAYKQKSYDGLFALLEKNAPRTKTVVACEKPVDAGVVGVSPGVVQVLLFIDCPTTNTTYKKPYPFEDEATLTMVKVGDRWLVNQIVTNQAQA